MGSTLVLSGGAANTKTLKELLTQVGHGFVVGDVLRLNTSNGKYVKAKADNATNAEVVGVVNSITDADNFEITYSGYLSVPALAGVSFPVMFLSGETAGELTNSPPSFIGSVVKAVVSRNHLSGGYIVTNYLGTQIGGSSTVSIDEVQPVGSIVPYAGSVVPESWLECNGASYSVADYSELYSRLLERGGSVPIYGSVVSLSGAGAVSANFAIGDIVQFKTNAAAFTGTNSGYDSDADVVGIILALTSSGTATANGTLVVQTIPKYDSTSKKFTFPTVQFGNGTGTGTLGGSANYRVLNPGVVVRTGGANLTVSSVALTHFNVPDIRGRFVVGTNAAAIAENADLERESDTSYNSELGQFSLGQEGGSETIFEQSATVATWNSTDGETVVKSSASPKSIKPPYLATKYIVKAKPYTRAAIVDSVNLNFPYETGTFTSTITYSSTLTSTNPSTADKTTVLRYVKIGKQVTVWSPEITFTTTFSSTPVIVNTFSLPFTVGGYAGTGSVTQYNTYGRYDTTVSDPLPTVSVWGAGNVVYIRPSVSSGWGYMLLNAAGASFNFTYTYETP
jgi:microcystin-dependent protein